MSGTACRGQRVGERDAVSEKVGVLGRITGIKSKSGDRARAGPSPVEIREREEGRHGHEESSRFGPDQSRRRLPRTPQTEAEVTKAVDVAVKEWGERSMDALQAEDKLSVACEKGPTDDAALLAIRAAFRKIEAEYDAVVKKEREEVRALGGLHVVGTERHESRRIDNQLRGRGGRQGDPGSTRFFLSLEDNLFRVFGGDRIQGMMDLFRVGDLPIESGMLTKSLDEAQRKVEAYFFDIRKNLFEYDQVINTQRAKIYAERRLALQAPSLAAKVRSCRRTVLTVLFDMFGMLVEASTAAGAMGVRLFRCASEGGKWWPMSVAWRRSPRLAYGRAMLSPARRPPRPQAIVSSACARWPHLF